MASKGTNVKRTIAMALMASLAVTAIACVTVVVEQELEPTSLANAPASPTSVLKATPTEEIPVDPGVIAAVPGEFYFRATSAEHIDWGSRGSGYVSDPPTSGQHYSVPGVAPTNWGIYSNPIQDEILIHNMEHGGIIAYYLPSTPPAEIEQLRQFIVNQPGYPRGFIMAPRSRLPANITLAAWEYYLPVFQYNESIMQAFIDAHYDRGPETLDGTLR